MFFSNHARSVTILCRGDGLEQSMSRYLVDQLATRSNIGVLARDRGRGGRTARHRLEAIEVRDAATGETTRLESGGLFIFIGADAETAWLPPEIALDRRGYVLTGLGRDAPRDAGSSTATRTCSRRASRASSPAATSAPAPSSASPRPSARAAWRSPSCTSI